LLYDVAFCTAVRWIAPDFASQWRWVLGDNTSLFWFSGGYFGAFAGLLPEWYRTDSPINRVVVSGTV